MTRFLRCIIVLGYLAMATLPLYWMAVTSIKPERFATSTNLNLVPAFGRALYEGVIVPPPPAVRENAAAALERWRQDDPLQRGLIGDDDARRARALAEGAMPGEADIRVLLTWLRNNREGIRNHPTWDTKGRNWQNWMGRGGDEALPWLEEMARRMDAEDAYWAGNVAFPPSTQGYAELRRPVVETDSNTYFDYLLNSLIIGICSTFAAVVMGTSTAYGFSRFRIPGSKDWLFFILSTRFLPPLAVVVPILMMYRRFDLSDTHLGLIVLYTSFNLSLAVWLMKGFIDEIPRAYEDAAMMDGYSRPHIFCRIIVPKAMTGMAVTAVFCLISAWNEYGFARIINSYEAKTVPVFFAGLQGGVKGIPWHKVAAGSLIFVLPIIVFTVMARRYLLRGVTFGTIKQ